MPEDKLKMLAENEREWRQHMLLQIDEVRQKVDHIDKELSTFKLKIFAMASLIGGVGGVGSEYIKKIFLGG